MNFIRRLAYFLGGFGIGIILLFFILNKKGTSCDYGMQGRTLKNIRIKDRAFSESSLAFFKENNIDTTTVDDLLVRGKVIFKESNTKLDSCKQYVIQGEVSERIIQVRIANCDDLATVMEAYFKE